MTWNVRAIPHRTRSSGGSGVMSLPSKTIAPAVGAKSPLTRLKNVVFPAPFGPMMARSSPGSIVSEMSSIAVSEPKRFVAFVTCNRLMKLSRCGARRARRAERTGQPTRTEPDRRHPVLGVAGDDVLRSDENRRADQRAPERSHAAKHRHDDKIAGEVEAQRARIGEIVQQRIERAGRADEDARDYKRQPNMALDGDAEEARAPLVLADRRQRAAEGRGEKLRHDPDAEGEQPSAK